MKKIVSLLIISLVALLPLAGCSSGQATKITQLSDLEGRVVATVANPQDPAVFRTVLETAAGVSFEDMRFFETASAALAALKSGQIDALFAGDLAIHYSISQDDSLAAIVMPDSGGSTVHMALRADDTDLLAQINNAITSMQADGTLAKLEEDYITGLVPGQQLEGAEMPHFEGAPVLHVGVSGDGPPLDYVAADGQPAGYNAQFLAILGEKLGVNIEISVTPVESKFPALAAERIDLFFFHIVDANVEMTIKTLEANANITLSEPYYEVTGWGYLVMK